MNVNIWLRYTHNKLSHINTARLDCLVLLEDVTGKERGWLLAHPEFELSSVQIKKLDGFVERRAEHEPLAYIRNKTEFYGRNFYIDHRALEPRPESETIIDQLKNLQKSHLLQDSLVTDEKNEKIVIVDVGTGSGALAITAKLELPQAKVIASDIDKGCLAVAKINIKNLKSDVELLKGDLLESILKNKYSPHVLLANLPYVPDNFQINPAAMREPRVAIFGGGDGLNLYRKFFSQMVEFKLSPRYVLTESMPPQHQKLAQIAKAAGYKLVETDDFIQLFETA